MKVLLVFGTRPEAIKMCPLILELKKHKNIECKVCLSGQHREMLRQVIDAFQIVEDYNLNIMRDKQTLTTITADILERLETVLLQEKPDFVLVHGDTTTSFASALAAYYLKIPVGHVEAGLRTGNKYSPFPEEINRGLIGRIASYHFAPTKSNQSNLYAENITNHVYVTGNTVIDAFRTTIVENYVFHVEQLNQIDYRKNRVILLTAHRRENLGKPLENICNAAKKIVQEDENVVIVFPVHLNPEVRKIVQQVLTGIPRIMLIDPLDVLDMHNLMSKCYIVMTDSGGLQEEAPALGIPVLVMRTETERGEAVEAGTVKLVGIDKEEICKEVQLILRDENEYRKMAKAVNPYGDGHASERIATILLQEFEQTKENHSWQ